MTGWVSAPPSSPTNCPSSIGTLGWATAPLQTPSATGCCRVAAASAWTASRGERAARRALQPFQNDYQGPPWKPDSLSKTVNSTPLRSTASIMAVTIAETGAHFTETALKSPLSPPVTMRRNDRSHSPKYALWVWPSWFWWTCSAAVPPHWPGQRHRNTRKMAPQGHVTVVRPG